MSATDTQQAHRAAAALTEALTALNRAHTAVSAAKACYPDPMADRVYATILDTLTATTFHVRALRIPAQVWAGEEIDE